MASVDKLIDMLDIPVDLQPIFRQIMNTAPGDERNELLDQMRQLCGPRLEFDDVYRAVVGN